MQAVPTVETFAGCLVIIEATKPDLVILENVPKLDAQAEAGERPDLILIHLYSIQYTVYILNSYIIPYIFIDILLFFCDWLITIAVAEEDEP